MKNRYLVFGHTLTKFNGNAVTENTKEAQHLIYLGEVEISDEQSDPVRSLVQNLLGQYQEQ